MLHHKMGYLGFDEIVNSIQILSKTGLIYLDEEKNWYYYFPLYFIK